MQVGEAEIAILSLYLASLPAVNTATGQVLSTQPPVDHGHHPASCDTLLVLIVGDDDKMFMIRSLNVMPKTTEQHI